MSQMPVGDPTLKTLQDQIAELRRDLDSLRRKVPNEGFRLPERDNIVFSHPGPPAVGTISPPYTYRRPLGYVTRVTVAVDAPGANDDTVVEVLRRRAGMGDGWEVIAEVEITPDDYDYTTSDDLMSEVEELDQIAVRMGWADSALANITVTVTCSESVE